MQRLARCIAACKRLQQCSGTLQHCAAIVNRLTHAHHAASSGMKENTSSSSCRAAEVVDITVCVTVSLAGCAQRASSSNP
eukprot:10345-Heterococcus_DN1.PRE.2